MTPVDGVEQYASHAFRFRLGRAPRMSPQHRRQIRQEVDLIQRFADSYRRKFADLIDRMNRATTATTGPEVARPDLNCLKLCVEAVDMMLATHHRLAAAVARLSDDTPDDAPASLRRAA